MRGADGQSVKRNVIMLPGAHRFLRAVAAVGCAKAVSGACRRNLYGQVR
jgi:hypothetical protein